MQALRFASHSTELQHRYSPDLQTKRHTHSVLNQSKYRSLNHSLQLSPQQGKAATRYSKPSPERSTIHTMLKKLHKTRKTGTQVVNLPKLPFGRHQSYNSEEEFTKTHFVVVERELTPKRKKDLEDLQHKFRLAEKRGKNKFRLVQKGILTANHDKVVFNLHSGSLVISNDNDLALDAYDFQQTQFALKKLTVTNRELERNLVFENEVKRRVRSMRSSIDMESSSTRLHEGSGNKGDVKSLPVDLARKFDALNEITADSKRWLKRAKRLASVF